MESFKFLRGHITDNLKWSIHTDNVVKKEQQLLFKLRRLKKFGLAPKTDAPLRASYRAVSPPGTAIAPSTTAGLSRGWCGQPNTSPGSHCLSSRTPTALGVTGRPRISSMTSATRATACSPHYHQEGRDSTGASNLGLKD